MLRQLACAGGCRIIGYTTFGVESGRIWPNGPWGRGQPRRVSAHALTSKGSVTLDRSLVSPSYLAKPIERPGPDRRIRLRPSRSVTTPLPWLAERVERCPILSGDMNGCVFPVAPLKLHRSIMGIPGKRLHARTVPDELPGPAASSRCEGARKREGARRAEQPHERRGAMVAGEAVTEPRIW